MSVAERPRRQKRWDIYLLFFFSRIISIHIGIVRKALRGKLRRGGAEPVCGREHLVAAFRLCADGVSAACVSEYWVF